MNSVTPASSVSAKTRGNGSRRQDMSPGADMMVRHFVLEVIVRFV